MNSDNEPLPTTPPVPNLSPSSSTVESSQETNTKDFATEPLTVLLGQCPKLMEDMTEQELRAFLQTVQTNRASAQTFRASLAAKEESNREKRASRQVVEGFEDLV